VQQREERGDEDVERARALLPGQFLRPLQGLMSDGEAGASAREGPCLTPRPVSRELQ